MNFNKPDMMHFPDSLEVNENYDPGAGLTTSQLVDATKKAVDHPDAQTIFFVGFRPIKPPDYRLGRGDPNPMTKMIDMVESWQAWSCALCEGDVQNQINNKTLPAETDGQFARSTYRAKVFDYLFRRSLWFFDTFDEKLTKHIEVKEVDFHAAFLRAILEDFSIPKIDYDRLEEILFTIEDNIMLSEMNEEKQQYWLMLTRYDWQPWNKAIQPVIRVVSFSISQKMREYVAERSSYTSISIDLQFSQYQADFETRKYWPTQRSIDDSIIKAGRDLVKQRSTLALC